ncbi:MAG: hypothetical protein EBE86_014320 [Hormoscilla sp. GUM202]|nr:hypothetical protein [Hormoscilla sp. GUM202]
MIAKKFMWDNWIVLGLLSPMIWAIAHLIDTYFVGGDVLTDEYDGTIVTSIFHVSPLIIFPFIKLEFPPIGIFFPLIILGGLFYSISSFFYFKALFKVNDVSIIEVLANIAIALVPIMSFFALHEQLSIMQYIGFGITIVGACTLSLNKSIEKHDLLKVLLPMIGAVTFLSMCVVIEEAVYRIINFWSGFLFFCLGCGLGGVIFWLIRAVKFANQRESILEISKKNFKIFLTGELLSLVSILLQERSIDVSSSPSLVLILQSLIPIFILLFSFLSNIVLRENEKLKEILMQQTKGWTVKTISTLIIAMGIYLSIRYS